MGSLKCADCEQSWGSSLPKLTLRRQDNIWRVQEVATEARRISPSKRVRRKGRDRPLKGQRGIRSHKMRKERSVED